MKIFSLLVKRWNKFAPYLKTQLKVSLFGLGLITIGGIIGLLTDKQDGLIGMCICFGLCLITFAALEASAHHGPNKDKDSKNGDT